MAASRRAWLAPLGQAALVAAVSAACESPAVPAERECAPPTVQAPLERGEVADGELFVVVSSPLLDSAQARQLATLGTLTGTLGVSVVRVADSARSLLAEGRLLGLRLSGRARTIGRVDRVTDHCSSSEPGCDPPQRYASGLVVAENAAAHFGLLLAAAGMVGNVSRGGFLYWIQPIGGGLHAISERSWCELGRLED